jgi:hypothetical protein
MLPRVFCGNPTHSASQATGFSPTAYHEHRNISLEAFRLEHSGVTGEWVFGQSTNCGIMAAPYGIGFPAMDED